MPHQEITEAPMEFAVPKRFAGLRLSQFLKRRLPRLGKNTAAKLIASGKVTIGNETIRQDQILDAGMWVSVLMRQSHSDPTAVDLPLEIRNDGNEFAVGPIDIQVSASLDGDPENPANVPLLTLTHDLVLPP
ncbi:MAG: hypothetical protein QF886_01435, partial [Planctomycetota bacterium]|nr:hypothetical protein [Planctomycetota bacterium]